MGVSKRRRHAGRAVRKRRRQMAAISKFAAAVGIELHSWQLTWLVPNLIDAALRNETRKARNHV